MLFRFVGMQDFPFIGIYTQEKEGLRWLQRHQGRSPLLACVLGFTETGLIPGISAAGATPADRQYTAIADAEFLYNGPQPHPCHPLPPLQMGASPVLISRAVVEQQRIPVSIFDAGLPQPAAIPAIALGGAPARCLSTGEAMDMAIAKHLFDQGVLWGEKLATDAESGYVILSECVVGGTTTALAVLTGLGFAAVGKVNSSHPICNHKQKWELVTKGLVAAGMDVGSGEYGTTHDSPTDSADPLKNPFNVVAAVGDPMQVVVAGMAIAASRRCGVLLAGGTQMLAVYALARAIANQYSLPWQLNQIVVGTTKWVVNDPTGDTIGLAQILGQVPLLGTRLDFSQSRFPQLRAYEQGFVKEGVGAGGCAIAAHLYQAWGQRELLSAIEILAERYQAIQRSPA